MQKVNSILRSLVSTGSWRMALTAARRTMGKEPIDKEPSDSWKAKLLLAEHSPIRLVRYYWTWDQIRQWVTVHLVRHHEGCEKWVHTQRPEHNSDIIDRDELPQGSLNEMDMEANAQSLINISRKRLCLNASPETRLAWNQVKKAISEVDPILAEKMVPECIYRGFCPELHKCGFAETDKYFDDLQKYRNTDYDHK